MNQRLTLSAVTSLIGTTLMMACASGGTHIVHSWREPSAGPVQFKKVLVLCFAPYDSQQLFGEGELVRLMKRTQGVAAHSIMSVADAKDPQKMRAVMEREGFDGAVTLRYLGQEQELTRSGGYIPSATDFWAYYAGVLSVDYNMGYVRIDRHVHMETQIFSMKDDKLVWSGVSDTMNPDSAQKLVEGVAAAVAAALRQQHLVD